jgi:hypothetical protein
MPEKAKVRTRAMVAAERSAVRAQWPEPWREFWVYRRIVKAMVMGPLDGSPGVPN